MGDPYEVTISGRFGAVRQLEAFSDDVRHRRRRLPVHLDLSRVWFMRPLAVIGTVLFMEEMISRGRDMQVTFPQNAGVLNYLVAIGLPDVMEQFGEWRWPEDFPQKATQGLRPMIKVTGFSSSDDIERIASQMEQVFDTDSILPSTLRFACYQVFSELADNVLHHADTGGYVLAQRFEYKEGPVIDITVGDGGIGMKQALWRNARLRPQLRDDRAAVRLALIDGVTGTSDPHRGFGLGHVNEELSVAGRKLVLRSGGAVGSWKEGRRTQLYECGASIGTLVHAVIPC